MYNPRPGGGKIATKEHERPRCHKNQEEGWKAARSRTPKLISSHFYDIRLGFKCVECGMVHIFELRGKNGGDYIVRLVGIYPSRLRRSSAVVGVIWNAKGRAELRGIYFLKANLW